MCIRFNGIIFISICAGATPAPAVLAHHQLALLQVGPGNSADAGGFVVGVVAHYALQTA